MLERLEPTSQQVRLSAFPDKVGDQPLTDAAKRFLFFRKDDRPGASIAFYPLNERLRSHRPNIAGLPVAGVAPEFVDGILNFGFDDLDLISLVHELSQLDEVPKLNSNFVDRARWFLDGKEPKRGGFDREDDSLTTPTYAGFLGFLDGMVELAKKYGQYLERNRFFADIRIVAEQTALIKRIIEESQFNIDMKDRGLRFYLPDEFKKFFSPTLHEMLTRVDNPIQAKHDFLLHLGLGKYVKHFLAIAAFVNFVAITNSADAKHRGVFPTVEEGREGLCFDFENFAHAERGTNSAIRFLSGLSAIGDSSRAVIDRLRRAGLVVKEKKEDLILPGGMPVSMQPSEYLKFKEGLTREELVGWLDTDNVTDEELRRYVLEQYDQTAFVPLSHIRLDTRNRIKILTGRNGRGKTALMKSVADQLALAMMGRRVVCSKAWTTMCDRVFHDFDVRDDISKGVSRFRAQIQNVVKFLQEATPNSLGLFDELYHGTNSAYLLALGWATLEAFSKRNLRAIVATHEPLLTLAASAEGYERLRGRYHRPSLSDLSPDDGIEGLGDLSIGTGYSLSDKPVMDSDAFAIAEEERLPDEILARAREIFEHITAAPAV